ncbi:MAG TPA: hypothetical protein VFO53_08100 [Casimicrobiaceae bacterium]|nr:hypothetical protein [Casimicrobiaceae bacterium]
MLSTKLAAIFIRRFSPYSRFTILFGLRVQSPEEWQSKVLAVSILNIAGCHQALHFFNVIRAFRQEPAPAYILELGPRSFKKISGQRRLLFFQRHLTPAAGTLGAFSNRQSDPSRMRRFSRIAAASVNAGIP